MAGKIIKLIIASSPTRLATAAGRWTPCWFARKFARCSYTARDTDHSALLSYTKQYDTREAFERGMKLLDTVEVEELAVAEIPRGHSLETMYDTLLVQDVFEKAPLAESGNGEFIRRHFLVARSNRAVVPIFAIVYLFWV